MHFLTTDQLAKRLQISRTTIFTWLKNGKLKQGRDYVRIGRIIRFTPSERMFAQADDTNEEVSSPLIPCRRPVKPPGKRNPTSTEPAVNLDY